MVWWFPKPFNHQVLNNQITRFEERPVYIKDLLVRKDRDKYYLILIFSTKSVKEVDNCHQLIFTWLVNSSWNRLQQKDFYLGCMILIYGEELVINKYEKDKNRLKVKTCHLLWDLNLHNAAWSMQRCWIMTIIIRLMHKTAGSDMISLVGNEQTCCLGENWSNQDSKQMEFIWEFQINPARWPDMNLLVRWESEKKLEVKKHYFSQPVPFVLHWGFFNNCSVISSPTFFTFLSGEPQRGEEGELLDWEALLGCRDSMSPDLFKLIKKKKKVWEGQDWGREVLCNESMNQLWSGATDFRR